MCRPELTDPLKVTDAWHLLLHQFGCYIFSMDLYNNEGRQHSSLYLRQISSHQLHQVTELHKQKEKCKYINIYYRIYLQWIANVAHLW